MGNPSEIFHANGYNVCATGTNIDKLSLLEKKYQSRFKVYNVISQMMINRN